MEYALPEDAVTESSKFQKDVMMATTSMEMVAVPLVKSKTTLLVSADPQCAIDL